MIGAARSHPDVRPQARASGPPASYGGAVRLHSPRRGLLVTTALVTCLLAGCGSGAGGGTAIPGPDPSSTEATADPTTRAAPTTAAATSSPAPTRASPTRAAAPSKAPPRADAGPAKLLPWPTADPARLQKGVDGGAQPWLLDPEDLAASYVSATYGWATADTTAAPGGTSAATKVEVRNSDGSRRTLTCAQPGRKGSGGIWLVTADTKA